MTAGCLLHGPWPNGVSWSARYLETPGSCSREPGSKRSRDPTPEIPGTGVDRGTWALVISCHLCRHSCCLQAVQHCRQLLEIPAQGLLSKVVAAMNSLETASAQLGQCPSMHEYLRDCSAMQTPWRHGLVLALPRTVGARATELIVRSSR